MALCHEWLNARHGSEKTFEAMAKALPGAALHALTRNPSADFDFGGRRVATTFLDHPLARSQHRARQLPLMPLAWRYASGARYDVVVTSSHACAKGFRPGREAIHLCYCYTPMRYAWLASLDQRRRRSAASVLGERLLQRWDSNASRWVDEFAAISTAVQERVRQFYDRDAIVIHPPVDTSWFTPDERIARSDFALAVSRMVPYKRLDLAVRAAHRAGCPLVVAGAGPEEAPLRALSEELGAQVRFVVDPSDADLRDLYRAASVVVFPAEEDFGIVPVEAQACGTPVVAYGRGGALDTVVPGGTGLLVDVQEVDVFAAAIDTVRRGGFDPAHCRANAERFSADRFRTAFLGWVTASAGARGVDLGEYVARPA